MHEPGGAIRVLHVDDDPEFAGLAADFLERDDRRFEVDAATCPRDGLDALAGGEFDCVVSDYDMPHTNGIEFLEAVRETYPDLPFILFTGKGSEKVASRAISAGVTDYLQKGGTEKYELLANRIERAVMEGRLREFRRDMKQDPLSLIERLSDPLYALDDDWEFTYLNRAAEELFGADREELLDSSIWDVFPEATSTPFYDQYHEVLDEGEPRTIEEEFEPWGEWYREYLYPSDTGLTVISQQITDEKQREFEFERNRELLNHVEDLARIGGWELDGETETIHWTDGTYRIHGLDPNTDSTPALDDAIGFFHPDDRETILKAVERCLSAGERYEKELRIVTEGGRERWVRTHGEPVEADGDVTAARGAIQDITERKRREQELEQRNERLEEFSKIVSHDLRNPLAVARNRLELARTEVENEHLDGVARAHRRMDDLIDDLLTVARYGRDSDRVEPVELATVAERCWHNVETADATLVVETDRRLRADRKGLEQLLENLTRNAIEHGGDDVTVTVGPLTDGFYVEDDGDGIPSDDSEKILEAGYSTATDGTGFGLSIVERVVNAHDWRLGVTDGSDGGARFEITGVDIVGDGT